MIKNKLKLALLILLILNVIMGYVILYNPEETKDPRVFADVPDEVISPILPSPTPKAQIEMSEMLSPDGKENLVLKKTEQGTITRFAISTIDQDGVETTIYETNTDGNNSYSLPYNSWSPDNQYFFVEKNTSEGLEYLVFRANGEPIRSDEDIINATETFYDKIENFTLEEITGWASPTLLVANTITQEGDQKVSFWIEIPNKSVLKLGTYFE